MFIFQWLKDFFQQDRLGGASRSNLWPKVRSQFLKDNPVCALCGGNKKIEIHHIKPFNQNPELELISSNLIALCENKKNGITCHQAFGHLGNYQSWNENVVVDVQIWHDKILNRP